MQKIEEKDFRRIKALVGEFRYKYGLSNSEVLDILSSDDTVPICIFNDILSPFETIVKYLYENRRLRYSEIAKILKKETSACWTAYNNSLKKYPKKFELSVNRFDIPLQVLSSGKLSLLELISRFLKEKHALSYSDAGKLLHRNEKTLWTAYNRAKNKLKRKR